MQKPSFDTLKYVKLLTKHNFSQSQSEGLMSAQVLALQQTLNNMATQADLQHLEYTLRAEMKEMEHRLEAKIIELEHRFDLKLNELEHRLKSFVLKTMISTIIGVLGLNIGLAAVIITAL